MLLALLLIAAACGGGGNDTTTTVAGGDETTTTAGQTAESSTTTTVPDTGPKSGGTLTIGADADPIGLDPITTAAFSSSDFMTLLFNGLLRWSPTMELEPDLAESYDIVDDTTYVFTLRQGVKFHNGQDFTAEDVKYTIERILDPETGSPRITQYSLVESVTVDNPYQVTITLSGPDATFLSTLASSPSGAIVPVGVEGHDDHPIGTGPFKFESYEPGVDFTLSKFEDYFEEGLPYLDEVVFRFFGDQASIISALRSRAIDMTYLKDPKVAAQVTTTNPEIISAPGQTSRTFPIWFNIANEPFDDVNVRRAISLASDRQAAVDTVLAGSGKPAGAIPESQIGGFDGSWDLPYNTRDVEEAKRLLAEAGYPDGIHLGEFPVVAANDLDVQVTQILQEQWEEAGITVDLRPIETAPLLEAWRNGDFNMLSVALAWTSDPDVIVSRVLSTNPYGAAMNINDAELDAMITEARTTIDETARAELYREIQNYIADNAYTLHIYQYPLRWEMWWEDVAGYHPLANNLRTWVRTTWIDAE